MGGGGSGGSRNVGDLIALTESAKRALSQQRRNVFISFAYEDIDEVNLLRAQSKNELSEVAFNDWSISEAFDSTNASYIKQQIAERIRQSSVTVAYVSDATASSKWVEWEVSYSQELGKPIVAVYAGTTPPSRLPTWATNTKLIPWSDLAKTLKSIR